MHGQSKIIPISKLLGFFKNKNVLSVSLNKYIITLYILRASEWPNTVLGY